MKATDVVKVVLMCAVVAMCAGCGKEEEGDCYQGSRQIYVKGYARITLVPDMVTVETSVVTLDKDAAKSLAENDRITRAVLDIVRQMGIDEKDVQTGTVSLAPKVTRYDDKPPETEGIEAAKGITITVRDLTKYDPLIKGLVGAGMTHIESVSFESSKEAETIAKVRIMAIEDAKKKAEVITSAVGTKIGPVSSISVEDLNVGKRSYSGSSSSGLFGSDDESAALAPGTIPISIEIELEFELRD